MRRAATTPPLFKFCDELATRARRRRALFPAPSNRRLDQPEARGSFVGLASWHGLPELIRAIFEGVAFEHRRHIDRLLKGRALAARARFAGGAARSGSWLDIFAAAIVAAVGVGLHGDLETAVAAMTRVRLSIEPDRALVDALARRRAIYGELCEAPKPTWPKS